jgi:hypothetical protein
MLHFSELFNSSRSIYRAAPLLALVTFIPATMIIWLTTWLLEVAGVTNLQLPSVTLKGWGLPMAAVLGPLVETALLAAGLWLITRVVDKPKVASAISATCWALLHGLFAPLWFVGVLWPFYIFSRAYLAWRCTGRSNAIGIAWLTHALHNSLAIATALLTIKLAG